MSTTITKNTRSINGARSIRRHMTALGLEVEMQAFGTWYTDREPANDDLWWPEGEEVTICEDHSCCWASIVMMGESANVQPVRRVKDVDDFRRVGGVVRGLIHISGTVKRTAEQELEELAKWG